METYCSSSSNEGWLNVLILFSHRGDSVKRFGPWRRTQVGRHAQKGRRLQRAGYSCEDSHEPQWQARCAVLVRRKNAWQLRTVPQPFVPGHRDDFKQAFQALQPILVKKDAEYGNNDKFLAFLAECGEECKRNMTGMRFHRATGQKPARPSGNDPYTSSTWFQITAVIHIIHIPS